MNTSLSNPMTTPTMVRRDPFGLLFDDFFNDAWMRPLWPAAMSEMPAVARARMDVVDKGNAFEITVDLPGVKKDDIHVTVEGDHVAIEAQMKSEKETKDGDRLLHVERSATSYARRFQLPAGVTDAGAEAVYENGVLRLTLPKREPAGSRRLTVN